jgi:hypothetical protein
MTINRNRNGTPRLGRPPGPTSDRGRRPWDDFNLHALLTVAANFDLPRFRVAEHLGMSGAKLSTITCSPRGRATLEQLKLLPLEKLQPYVIAA